MPASQSLAVQYESRLAMGQLRPDQAQAAAASVLQNLADRLNGYRPVVARSRVVNFLGETKPPPHGLYLYGDVGRGKSMLMDMFFEAANVAKKRRVHFHQFMLEVHARLFEMQQGRGETENVIPRLAHDIAKEAWLLCFDEFHVGNIADAMILGRLFSALLDDGVVIVATSNWPPDELYKNGLQRERFLPFIDIIMKRMDVHRLDGGIDHRYEQLRGTPNYFSPLGPVATARLDKIFAQLTAGAVPQAVELPVQGRLLAVPRAAKGAAFFTFDQLCRRALGAADYLAVADCFQTLVLDGVPQFTAEGRDEVTRFMTLIDALYEAKVKLFMGASTSPEKLGPATGDLSFAFHRTASRLAEMQGEDYRHKAHLG